MDFLKKVSMLLVLFGLVGCGQNNASNDVISLKQFDNSKNIKECYFKENYGDVDYKSVPYNESAFNTIYDISKVGVYYIDDIFCCEPSYYVLKFVASDNTSVEFLVGKNHDEYFNFVLSGDNVKFSAAPEGGKMIYGKLLYSNVLCASILDYCSSI